MFKKIVIIICIISCNCSAQVSFPYEKELEEKENYRYYDISSYQEKDHFTLRGSLITPLTDFDKVVVIVPGSGKDTRNCHFKLAEEMLKNNIAVFRYDEKGLGKSEGKYGARNGITSMSWDLFYLIKTLQQNENLKNKKIGLIGHSEGGMITIGAIEKGVKIDFLLQWATPVQKIGTAFKYQIKTGFNKQEKNLLYSDDETKYLVMDNIDQIIEENSTLDIDELRKIIKISLKKSGFKEKQFGWYISSPSRMDALRTNNESTYKNIDIPMLYIIGDTDKQVDPNANIDLLKSFHNSKIEMKVFDGLNHYLNHDELKTMSQNVYAINKHAEKYMINWILTQN